LNNISHAMRTHLIFNDLHIPYHQPDVLGAILGFGREFQPDQIDIPGDLLDCIGLTLKYRAAQRDERVHRVQFEIDQGQAFLKLLRDLFPKVDIHLHEGNHEDRLNRYVNQHCPELRGLHGLSVPGLLDLAGLKITWHPLGQLGVYGNLHITHGDLIRQHSAYTARSMLEKYGVCVLFGHTHRGGVYYKTAGRKTWAAWENFCTCRFDMPWVVGCSNWQHGFSVVHNDMRTRFHVQQVPIIGGQFVYAGQEFRVNRQSADLVRDIKRAKV